MLLRVSVLSKPSNISCLHYTIRSSSACLRRANLRYFDNYKKFYSTESLKSPDYVKQHEIDAKNTAIHPGNKIIQDLKSGKYVVVSENIESEDDLVKAYDEYHEIVKSKEESGSIKCMGCGAKPLQSTDSSKDNYFKVASYKKRSTYKPENDLMNHFMAEKAKEMKLVTEKDIKFETKIKVLSELCALNIECNRCRELKKHGVLDIQHEKAIALMNQIPKNAIIVNVLSILDFPVSCDRKILEGRNPKDVWYVVTKADIFYHKEVQLNRTGIQYIKDTLEKYMDADPDKVFFVSADKNWNNKEFMSCLPNGDLYFVGRANAGKSSLIKSLIASNKGVLLNTKVVNKMEKKQKSYLHIVGLDAPGVYHIPGYTRGIQKYKIGKNIIYDTPGFFPNDTGVYKYMMPESIRLLKKYPEFTPESKKRFNKINVNGPKLFSGSSLYSYGGLFFLNPPKNSVIQTVIATNMNKPNLEAKYKDLERAREINKTRQKEIGNRFLLEPESLDELDCYVIPPFYGLVDLVFQDIGFISIKVTSSPKQVNGLFHLYVPKGIRVIMRESIFNFIYKTRDIKDETGNRLRKEKIAIRGAIRLRSVKYESKLHFTELVPFNEKDDKSRNELDLLACPEDENVVRSVTSQENYGNQFWRKLKL